MKYLFYLLVFFSLSINAQNNQTRILDNDENIFIKFDKDKTSVFVNQDNYSDVSFLKETNKFPLKKNYVNVYVEWLNPLKYIIVIKDSTYTNPTDVAVREYISQLTSNFSSQIPKAESVSSSSTSGVAATPAVKNCSVDFSNKHLIDYLVFIGARINRDTTEICKFSKSLEVIEDYELSTDLSKTHEFLNKLFNTDSYNSFLTLEKSIGRFLTNLTKERDEILFNIKTAEKENVKLYNTSPDRHIKNRVDNFLNEQKKIIEEIDKYISILGKQSTIVKNHKPSITINKTDYFLLDNLRINNDKEVLVSISQKKNKIEKVDFKISEESVLFKQDFTINKYDFIKPSIGTGVFFSSTNLNSFGVSSNDQGELMVTEEVINKNQIVTGLFLNLNFDVNSRFLEPLLQLGIDPTKKNPFLLIGAGFAIPTSKFAITGGPIWTWNAELDGISVGDTVESTSQLEDKTSFKFDIEPKGYYLGLVYNF
tara:strand:+ start:3073 stop:4515 length:1443 start_codon:yes stop_codon:yes gene_type:complete